MESASRYESRCPSCDVTFPAETKVCIHCGGRTGPSTLRMPALPPMGEPTAEAAPAIDMSKGRTQVPGSVPLELEEAEVGARSSPLRSMITLVWVALAIGISVLRACNDGG